MLVLLACGRAVAAPTQAELPPEPVADDPIPAVVGPADGIYAHLMAALAVGRGIRFNNPYRLATPLGDDAESLSLTATYADLGLTASFGHPAGLEHGASVHFSVALSGVPQEVVTPSYVLLHRFPSRFLAYGRAGLPFVLSPDPNMGYELAAGGAWFVTAGLGVTAELVGDLFYGAATQERAASTIPILSLQLGVLVDYEVLP